jgi:hypothetical protein
MDTLPANPSLQLNGSTDMFTAAQTAADHAETAQMRRRKPQREDAVGPTLSEQAPKVKRMEDPFDDPRYRSDGFWRDLHTGKWLLLPCKNRLYARITSFVCKISSSILEFESVLSTYSGYPYRDVLEPSIHPIEPLNTHAQAAS